ncbi:hypothetical protein BDM02DRAFT_3130921 [Thelephora ganbajun]|uniref:Uncharacterized protein n=1 Tax=Thelephora ganbajun TaxID=370292 RepID=A0ACB6Z8B3_THEGA|nr:hypothetical protein BDM02DRAFT_3130921 [Thelephora ganbajun]
MAFHIRFGIEVEFLLTLPATRKFHDLGLFAECVRALCQGRKDVAWPSMRTGIGGSYDEENSAIEWTLTYDSSIEDEGKYPIELVSPIFHFTPNDPFQDHVRGVWDCIEPPCAVWTNNSCGTHVHVSSSNKYTMAQVKAIARAILHFEPAVNGLVPPHRLNNKWCKTFFLNNVNFQDTDVAWAIARVDGAGSLKAIVGLVHPPLDDFPIPDRFYAWSFANSSSLLGPPRSTIEFRQGEGVTTPFNALTWVEFVVAFIGAALAVAGVGPDGPGVVGALGATDAPNPPNHFNGFPPNVDGLGKFMELGDVP